MRFASISLSNYIGIYNGMGLYDINIDMTKCKNRITVIRGSNGSGKSTLSKAMSLFPDPNDSFIPGLPARKEIVLIDGETLYKLVFVHGVKANGERETTKAYITKTFGNSVVELNENGNVSSYKEILYTELGLDANFAALSQLSNEDRGLADKKPAERKRFVNSIIESLETYNNIYKTLSKRSSNYKSMINAIVAKLSMLGDEEVLRSSLEAIEQQINALQDNKDKAVEELAKQQSIIKLLDPDNSIQLLSADTSKVLQDTIMQKQNIESIISSLAKANNITCSNFEEGRRRIIDNKNSFIIENQIARANIDALIRQKEGELERLNEKIQRLTTLKSNHSYEDTVNELNRYNAEIEAIKEQLSATGIADIENISKDEYILALETLKDLVSMISVFKSEVSIDLIEAIINSYLETGIIPPVADCSIKSAKISELGNVKKQLEKEYSELQANMSLMNILNQRPKNCTDDSCPFIKEAFEFFKKNPNDRMTEISSDLININLDIKQTSEDLSNAMKYNEAINHFSKIVREIEKNKRILSKMPNGDMFENTPLFFERLLSGYSFEYMRSIYQYIDLANLFDIYKQYKSIAASYESDLKLYESKNELINSLSADIDSINDALAGIENKIQPINDDILNRKKRIAQLQELEGVYDALIENTKKINEYQTTINECEKILNDINHKMSEINKAIESSIALKENINSLSSRINPLMNERDRLNHSMQLMNDYIKERDELQANYDFIETIKYYSSPTTGIQLVFMELYMGKIISLANELLSYLFKGQFKIQPFVINESEFRIPCLGNGYLNDDISSMSSSQIGMISMILSFALLHHSSTKYNIIKLDEIDGPLDYNNRVYFSDVLNRIMDIMGTEQCIMISHNTEFQSDNTDVILLKHNQEDTVYSSLGNIIWSY